MPTIYMIRHGEAAAGWNADADPGLSAKGQAQAEAVAREIESRVGRKLPLLSSPLRRCRETSVPLSTLWQYEVTIEPRVAEVPSPIDDLAERGKWLARLMAGSWTQALSEAEKPEILSDWRSAVSDALLGLKEDTVIFSHFIAINVAAGTALENDRFIVFRPDNCSVTVFNTDSGKLLLTEQGREAETKVN